MKATGLVLLAAGLLLTLFTTYYFFTNEKVVDLGKVEINKEKKHSVSWPPVIGVVVMAIGGLVLWQGSKK